MSYALYDVNGYLGDVASLGGLRDLREWSDAHAPALKAFLDEGHTTKVAELIAGLDPLSADGSVEDTRRGLLALARHAEGALILNDGSTDDDSEEDRARMAKALFNAGASDHSGLFVGAFLDAGAAALLARPGGEPARELHITLAYCGDIVEIGDIKIAEALLVVEAVVARMRPLVGQVIGTGTFPPSPHSDGRKVVYAIPAVPGLAALRTAIVDALVSVGVPPRTDFTWTPHITLAYVDPSDASMPSAPSVVFELSTVNFGVGDRQAVLPIGHHAKALKFNENQPRDPAGSSTGGQWAASAMSDNEAWAWHETGAVAKWATETLGHDDLEALSGYAGFGYKDVNATLRGQPPTKTEIGRLATPEERAQLDALIHATPGVLTWPVEITLEDGSRLRFDPYGGPGPRPGQLLSDNSNRYFVERTVVDESRRDHAVESARKINDVIEHRGVVLSSPLVVGRYAYFPGVTSDDFRASVGTDRVEQGFTSTMLGSADGRKQMGPSAARVDSIYARTGKTETSEVGTAVQFEIRLPTGTKVASVEAARRAANNKERFLDPTYRTRDYRSESEVLLGSGARFKVTDVRDGGTSSYGGVKAPVTAVLMDYVGGGVSEGKK